MTTTRFTSYIWAGLGVLCLIAAVSGNMFHLFTTGACYLMYKSCQEADERDLAEAEEREDE